VSWFLFRVGFLFWALAACSLKQCVAVYFATVITLKRYFFNLGWRCAQLPLLA